MEIGVADAASQLGIGPVRVRQLIGQGDLRARKVGSQWLVDSDDVGRRAARPRPPGRPMSPRRAWALLDLLDGGRAPWLSSSARSQVRAMLRELPQADAAGWRSALASRSQVIPCAAHPAAVARLLSAAGAVPVPLHAASAAGIDLVVVDAVPEVYVPAESWSALAAQLLLRPGGWGQPDVIVRVPRDLWPFAPGAGPGQAVIAADLLDSLEPRAVSGSLARLRELSAG